MVAASGARDADAEDWVEAETQDATAIRSGFAETARARLHYRSAGEGEPILLFHINRQSSELLSELLEALASDFHAIAMDYPGYGLSPSMAAAPAIEDYAACALELLQGLGHESAWVLGEAAGAAVAAAFGACFPDRTRGAVLLNCPFMPDRQQAAAFVGSVREKAATNDADGFSSVEAYLSRHGVHAPMAPTPDWLKRVQLAHEQCAQNRWQAADALLAFDLQAALGRLSCPVLLLTGAQSPFRARHDDVAAQLRNVSAHVIPDARFSMTWEHAGEVAQRTRQFATRH